MDFDRFKQLIIESWEIHSDGPFSIETWEQHEKKIEHEKPTPGIKFFQELEEHFNKDKNSDKDYIGRSIMSEMQTTEILELTKEQKIALQVLEFILVDDSSIPEFLNEFE